VFVFKSHPRICFRPRAEARKVREWEEKQCIRDENQNRRALATRTMEEDLKKRTQAWANQRLMMEVAAGVPGSLGRVP
jgi:hypothetical protein